jgi:methionyl-tRNA formyltransferase
MKSQIKKPIQLIFMGTSSFAIPTLKILLKNNNYNVLAVYTKPDKPQGRGLKLSKSPIKTFLEKNYSQIKIFQPKRFKIKEITEFKKLKPQLTVVAAYGIMIPKKILDIPQSGFLNIHPSLLPKYRGASPIQAAILNQDPFTGVTIMKLIPKMDAGDIIIQKRIKLTPNITTPKLHDQLAHLGAKLLINTIPDYLNQKIKPKRQQEKQATYTKLISKDDGRIKWKKTAKEIDAQIRAYTPWPGTFTFFKKGTKKIKITIIKAKPTKKTIQFAQKPPGYVFFKKGKTKRPVIKTGLENIEPLRIKPEGKKEMNTLEFINGYQDFIGSTLQ